MVSVRLACGLLVLLMAAPSSCVRSPLMLPTHLLLLSSPLRFTLPSGDWAGGALQTQCCSPHVRTVLDRASRCLPLLMLSLPPCLAHLCSKAFGTEARDHLLKEHQGLKNGLQGRWQAGA